MKSLFDTIENMFPLKGTPSKDRNILFERWNYLKLKMQNIEINVDSNNGPCAECDSIMAIQDNKVHYCTKYEDCSSNQFSDFSMSIS